MKKILISIIVVIILIVLGLIALIFDWGRSGSPVNNIPAQTTEIPIEVFFPKDNQEVSSPIEITGKARGYWYFEAVFPIVLVDDDGNIITSGYATADTEWMTTDFVNFHAYIEYPPINTGRATLILKKDNPSDNPEFDQSIFVPVILK